MTAGKSAATTQSFTHVSCKPFVKQRSPPPYILQEKMGQVLTMLAENLIDPTTVRRLDLRDERYGMAYLGQRWCDILIQSRKGRQGRAGYTRCCKCISRSAYTIDGHLRVLWYIRLYWRHVLHGQHLPCLKLTAYGHQERWVAISYSLFVTV